MLMSPPPWRHNARIWSLNHSRVQHFVTSIVNTCSELQDTEKVLWQPTLWNKKTCAYFLLFFMLVDSIELLQLFLSGLEQLGLRQGDPLHFSRLVSDHFEKIYWLVLYLFTIWLHGVRVSCSSTALWCYHCGKYKSFCFSSYSVPRNFRLINISCSLCLKKKEIAFIQWLTINIMFLKLFS